MELYRQLAFMRCFTFKDVAALTGSETAASWHIRQFLKKRYIERIRRDLYAVISLETDQPIPNRFQIASKLSDDAYVSHHSAFEYYGFANQVFHEVYVSVDKIIRPFSYDGLDYHIVSSPGNADVQRLPDGVSVTSIERTVIDSIADFEKIGGLEELLRCIGLLPSLSADELLSALAMYHTGKLYQKTGYLLEFFKTELNLPSSFFDECEKHMTGSKAYFSNEKKVPLQKRWKLYAPDDLLAFIDKGVKDHDAI